MSTIILKCTCKHAFQDVRYGEGRRVHNVGEANDKAVCTVCRDTKKIDGVRAIK